MKSFPFLIPLIFLAIAIPGFMLPEHTHKKTCTDKHTHEKFSENEFSPDEKQAEKHARTKISSLILTQEETANLERELKKTDTVFEDLYKKQSKDFNDLCLQQQQTGDVGPSSLKNFPHLEKFLSELVDLLCKKLEISKPTILLDQSYRCSSIHGNEKTHTGDIVALGIDVLRTFLVDYSSDEEQQQKLRAFTFLLAHECGHLHSCEDRFAAFDDKQLSDSKIMQDAEIAADLCAAKLCHKIFPNFTAADVNFALTSIGHASSAGLRTGLVHPKIKSLLNEGNGRPLISYARNVLITKTQRANYDEKQAMRMALDILLAEQGTYTKDFKADQELALALGSHYPTTLVRCTHIKDVLAELSATEAFAKLDIKSLSPINIDHVDQYDTEQLCQAFDAAVTTHQDEKLVIQPLQEKLQQFVHKLADNNDVGGFSNLAMHISSDGLTSVFEFLITNELTRELVRPQFFDYEYSINTMLYNALEEGHQDFVKFLLNNEQTGNRLTDSDLQGAFDLDLQETMKDLIRAEQKRRAQRTSSSSSNSQ